MITEIVKMRKCSLTDEEIHSLKRAAKLLADMDALDTTDSCWEDFNKDSSGYVYGWSEAADFLNELIEYIDEKENTLIFEEEIVE